MKTSVLLKYLFITSLVVLITACNDTPMNNPLSKEGVALEKIRKYSVSSSNPEPVLQDYIDAGISNISEETLPTLNSQVSSLRPDTVDSAEELDEIILKINNIPPVAYSKKVEIATYEESSIKIQLIAYDDDEKDTLNYIVEKKPEHGSISLVDNVLTYTPNEDYRGNDQVSFKVNDSLEDSNTAIVSIKVTKFPLMRAGGSSHLIWFNGTNEEIKDNSHLFSGLDYREYTVIKGWGLKPFWANYTFKSSAAVGIENDQDVYNRIDKYIKKRLKGKEEYILKSQSLMVGGFSRGAAFFVPYFLEKLDYFLPELSSTTFMGTPKEIVIFMMDPVNGSKNDEDYTASSLQALGIYNKSRLVNKLKNRGFTVKLLFLSSGFDYRKKNFKLDKTFYDIKSEFDYSYSAKLGLSHSSMSTWSVDNYFSEVLKSLKYGPYTSGLWGNIENDPYAQHQLKQGLSTIKPDLDITRNIFRTYLHEPMNITRNELDKKIVDYHNITERYLGQQAVGKGWGVSFDMPNNPFITLGYKFGNAVYKLSGHSRLGIPQEGSIDMLLRSQTLPTGSYSKTCSTCVALDGILNCQCLNNSNSYVPASVNYSGCGSSISNNNGSLACN